jgi:AraC-like DNA-binding protein
MTTTAQDTSTGSLAETVPDEIRTSQWRTSQDPPAQGATSPWHPLPWPSPAPREIGTLPLSRLRRVTDYIQEHLDGDLTLAQLGAVVYMSPYHFARLFHRTTGLPPHRFVVRTRIAQATALLAAPEPSIAQISRMVGFRTPSHFSTVFRRIMSVTPHEYRARSLQAGALHQAGGHDGSV